MSSVYRSKKKVKPPTKALVPFILNYYVSKPVSLDHYCAPFYGYFQSCHLVVQPKIMFSFPISSTKQNMKQKVSKAEKMNIKMEINLIHKVDSHPTSLPDSCWPINYPFLDLCKSAHCLQNLLRSNLKI